jgi:Mn-dependent DtxR family transcriptional regulator
MTQITVTSLSGLALAEYILMRIVENDNTVEKLTQDLDCKENYVTTLASILEDLGWIEQEPGGKYIITDKGNSEAQKY